MAGKYVKISFKDQGIGIPGEILQSIFDPYFTTKQQGSGLGLVSVYSINTKHGGYIDVSSEPGVGSTFVIYMQASEKELVAADGQAEVFPITGDGRVLVMDDEGFVRYAASEILTAVGYEVVTVAEGNEAIRLYKEAKECGAAFDIVVMDFTVPGGMGGKEAIESLLEYDPEVKAIVSSGYSNYPIMAEFEKYGFSGVVAKPYGITEFAAEVHNVLTGHGA